MSESTTPTSPAGQYRADAIAALTAAARQQDTIGQGTPSEHTRPVDFADLIAEVITAVAANLGSIETLLAGRPGSWEADHVRGLLEGTAGYDHTALMRYRTEPVLIAIDAEDIFADFGLTDLYDQAAQHLGAQVDALDQALLEAVATPAEAAILDTASQTVARLFASAQDTLTQDDLDALDAAQAVAGTIRDRAEDTGHPMLAALTRAEAKYQALDDQWHHDLDTYQSAYLATIRDAMTERGLTLQTHAVHPAEAPEWDPFTADLHAHARATTPLPMTGQAPDWTHGTPADALTRTGITYHPRQHEASAADETSPDQTQTRNAQAREEDLDDHQDSNEDDERTGAAFEASYAAWMDAHDHDEADPDQAGS
jgi:hypothetical protein